MARVIDITEQMKKERPKVKIGDRLIEVNNGSLAYQNFQAYQENLKNDYKKQIEDYKKENPEATIDEAKANVKQVGKYESFKTVMELFISEDDFNYLVSLDLDAEMIETLMVAIVAAASNKEPEEIKEAMYKVSNKKKAKRTQATH